MAILSTSRYTSGYTMARDKLLTIRIEEDKREAFNNWCESRNYNYSKFLYEVIEACLDNRIDESILTSQNIENNLANRLDKRIDKLEQQIDSKSIDSKIDKNVVSTEDLEGAIAKLSDNEKFIEAVASKLPA